MNKSYNNLIPFVVSSINDCISVPLLHMLDKLYVTDYKTFKRVVFSVMADIEHYSRYIESISFKSCGVCKHGKN